MSLRSLVLTSVAALAVTASAHATTFGFEGSIGATPTFSVTAGGNTATFSSVAGNMFAVQDTTGLLSFNTALVDNNFSSDTLTITFSTPYLPASGASIVIPFAFIGDSGVTTDVLTLMTNTGLSQMFTASPDSLPLGEPEGLAIFKPTTAITSITLNGTNAFAIGNVAATPEPSSIALLATGIAGVAFRIRRRSSL